MWKPMTLMVVPAFAALALAGTVAATGADSIWAFCIQAREHPTEAAASSLPLSSVAWNEAASRDLEHELHRLHEIWNTGDLASLKKYIIGDAVLPTFELDPTTHQPIKLSSKSELDEFVSKSISAQDDRNLKTKLAEPKTRCRATATWGVCTEECTVSYLRSDTGETVAVDNLRSTQIAVKTADGWRWIQWQMSDSLPPQSISQR